MTGAADQDPGGIRRALRDYGATLIDFAADPIVIFDDTLRVVDANEPALRVYGYERDEFLRLTLADLRAPADLAQAGEAVDRVELEDGLVRECVHRRKDGDDFLTVCSSRPLTIAGVRYVEMIVRGIEGRDPDMRRSEARYWALAQYMLNGCALCRVAYEGQRAVDFLCLEVNPAFGRLTGLKGVVGRWSSEIIPGLRDANPELFEICGSVAAGGQPRTFESFVPGIDRWFTVSAYSPARDHFVAVFDDFTAKKRAEEALQTSEERHRSLFETLAQGVVRRDTEGRIVEANPAAERILGLTAARLVGRRWFDPGWHAVHEDGSDYPFEDQPPMKALRTRRVTQGALVGIRRPGAGATTWIHLDAVPVFLPGEDAPYGVYSTFTDVTDSKATQEALAASESFLDNVIEHSPHALWIADENGGMIRLNQACRDLLQVTDEDVVGVYNVFRDDILNKQGHLPLVHRVFDAGETVHFRAQYDLSALRREPAQGPSVDLEITVSPVMDAGGQVVNAVIQAVEVTEREQVLRELRESQEQLEGVFRTSPTSIFVTRGEDGMVIDANEALAELFEVSRTGAIGQTTVELGLFGSADERMRLVEELNATGLVRDHEVEIRTKKGTARTVLISGAPLTRAGEICIVGTITDITRRKRAEGELRDLTLELERRVEARTAELEESNAALESFSYSLSHDLRAPLRHICGFAGILEEDYADVLDEQARHYIGSLTRSAREMEVLIDELLKFSRAGRAELLFAWVDMGRLVCEARELLGDSCSGREIDWSIPPLPEAWGDEALLRQVWVNLLSNAVKYTRTRERARIIIEVRETPAEYEFSVRDNGVGFDMRYVDKLFGVFQRLHNDARFEGVGIGLANVHRIVTRHGGRTWAEGVLDEGAVFGFSLPKKGTS